MHAWLQRKRGPTPVAGALLDHDQNATFEQGPAVYDILTATGHYDASASSTGSGTA